MKSEYPTPDVSYGAHFSKNGELELFVRGDEVFKMSAAALADMLGNADCVTVRCAAEHGANDAGNANVAALAKAVMCLAEPSFYVGGPHCCKSLCYFQVGHNGRHSWANTGREPRILTDSFDNHCPVHATAKWLATRKRNDDFNSRFQS